jgi:hypothetical protein
MNLQAIQYRAALSLSEEIPHVVTINQDSVSTKRRNIADQDVGLDLVENCRPCKIAVIVDILSWVAVAMPSMVLLASSGRRRLGTPR